MGYEQITIPRLACPKCLSTHSLHEIEGEPRIVRHYKRCDQTPPKANGWVEAADMAGIDPSRWNSEWKKYAIGWSE